MATKCSNCNTALSCGCQRRVASDGKQVCSTCLARYEAGLKLGKNKSSLNNNLETGQLASTDPTNISVIYTGLKLGDL